MQKTPKTKTTFRIERTTFESSVFRGLEKIGGLSNKFASMQRMIWLYAVGTSYDLRKTCLASLERGEAGNGSFVSGSCPYTKENKDGCQWGFFTNFYIFSKRIVSQHLGPDACSAVGGQWIRAKNIKDIKNIFQNILELQTFLYSTRA